MYQVFRSASITTGESAQHIYCSLLAIFLQLAQLAGFGAETTQFQKVDINAQYFLHLHSVFGLNNVHLVQHPASLSLVHKPSHIRREKNSNTTICVSSADILHMARGMIAECPVVLANCAPNTVLFEVVYPSSGLNLLRNLFSVQSICDINKALLVTSV